MVVILILLLLCAVFLLVIGGRRNHPGLAALRGWRYAHRGLHSAGVPENSMGAFRAALEHGYGIELDIHLLADGQLAVIHDSALLRTTGQPGTIEELTAQQLTDYILEGTQETIPLFSSVLSLFDGKAPLIVELKTAGNNASALCRAACDLLAQYNGPYCLESFDPRCIRWLRKNRPEIIRGQLAENAVKRSKSHPWLIRFVLTNHLLNFLTRPDFIAYHFRDRNALATVLCRKLWGLQGVAWTLRSQAEYDTAVKEGWLPIFENFTP